MWLDAVRGCSFLGTPKPAERETAASMVRLEYQRPPDWAAVCWMAKMSTQIFRKRYGSQAGDGRREQGKFAVGDAKTAKVMAATDSGGVERRRELNPEQNSCLQRCGSMCIFRLDQLRGDGYPTKRTATHRGRNEKRKGYFRKSRGRNEIWKNSAAIGPCDENLHPQAHHRSRSDGTALDPSRFLAVRRD